MPEEMFFMRTSFKQSEAQKLFDDMNPCRRTVVQYLETSSNAWRNDTPSGSAVIASFFSGADTENASSNGHSI